MGSYDISLHRNIAVSFVNCKQNNIMDDTKWGVWGSNYCKDIIVDNCIFSRVDAHMGVQNLTIKNSTIGWMGIKAIGWGLLLVENTNIFCGDCIEFRPDYGSSWDGELTLRNVKWYPPQRDTGGFIPEFAAAPSRRLSIIFSRNSGGEDFGYPCSLPKRINIENFYVSDNNMGPDYAGVSVFNISPQMNENLKDFDKTAEHPYFFTQSLNLRSLSTESGKGFALWSNYPINAYCLNSGDKDKPNFHAYVDGVDRLVLTPPSDAEKTASHRIAPSIDVRNCGILE